MRYYCGYMKGKNIFIATIVVIIILLFGFWYLIWPAFRVEEVNDEIPDIFTEVNNSIQNNNADVKTPTKTSTVSGNESPKNVTPRTPSAGGLSGNAATPQTDTSADLSSSVSVDVSVDKNTPPTNQRQDTNIPTSEVVGTFGHKASGSLKVYKSADSTILRFENFKTIDGPRLHVYLVKSLDDIGQQVRSGDFVDLGYRKGTSGDINYEIPSDVDIDDYNYIIHWCVPFRVLFNSAKI